MLNTMIWFRALIARPERQEPHFAPAHTEADLRAFQRALKRPVKLIPATA